MKQFLNYVTIAVVSIGSYWLYMKQFGAIPFLLLSIFFFYKTYDEVTGRAKKRRETKQISHSAAPAGKKTEIIT
ncbi:hypothetical protein [Domibacillus iocasae]|uniref:Uncharacterized protein n=1 Tax=Domibacillus iocasae TaxID=1714016 RepID=A0A1E7DP91_9BACI|nr:hypothetical protein [Domibacillus iocasae]OES44873.1 hypothetical protein BA724_06290 [Domibacillus iocasae]